MNLSEKQVDTAAKGRRLDAWLAEQYGHLSRGRLQELITEGMVLVDGKKVKASYKLKGGETVRLEEPDAKPLELKPEKLPLKIFYEDADVIVLDKPKGMVVHPAHGNWEGTLVNALLYHVKDLSGINGDLRPGIVHRLDKDTSGVMMAAKNDQAHRSLSEQIREHSITRQYVALVTGVISENLGTIDAPIGRSKKDRQKMAVEPDGRRAVSDYEVLERFQNFTLVRVTLHTGRTHQIRVHFAYIRHPLVGDAVYGSGKKHFGMTSQMLHAEKLGFVHPTTGEYMEFTSPLPDYFEQVLEELRRRER